jgi:glycosyltransferase involved in cell wall biosynthesis
MIVTVVTPSLNGIQYVRDCISSTRNQASDQVEVEHILVDAGSTDGTPEYAAAQGCKVIREKSGIFAAINTGSQAARGVLLGFLGCDDILLPGALDAVVRGYQRSGRRWIIGGCRWLDANGASKGGYRAPPSWLSAPMMASLGWSPIPHTATFTHRDLFAELGGFDATFKYAGDYEFFVRARRLEPFARVPRVLTCFRRHGANTSMQFDDKHMAELQSIAARFGPDTERQRTAYRYFLKVWLNGTNPWWFAQKRIDQVRRPDRFAAWTAKR